MCKGFSVWGVFGLWGWGGFGKLHDQLVPGGGHAQDGGGQRGIFAVAFSSSQLQKFTTKAVHFQFFEGSYHAKNV